MTDEYIKTISYNKGINDCANLVIKWRDDFKEFDTVERNKIAFNVLNNLITAMAKLKLP